MHFIDKKYVETPTTCFGDTVGTPIVGKSMDACAAACDSHMSDCVGFSYFGSEEEEPLCFLLSKFKSAVYYKGCDEEEKKEMFLQTKKTRKGPEVKCVAKLIEFEGQTLKPDGSGKCKACLKKLVDADRCFD
eukprot:gnl/TRDRNA2_/TRDRNA2_177906_c4_seq1.p1 gnl/TRDRNA2_/TRDRNA2_177906_c4~~gnl/TRDRNA2_/TRDRNA2_177906_c4_seq1.p1  ORF type:complete len:132 (-),score=42.99 gnl/TRDRNA2_/TRDRNA2_177906_c4_seq1:71-466(-)